MKFLGVFQNHNLPKIDMPKLFAYVDSREVIVSYNKEQPFYMLSKCLFLLTENTKHTLFLNVDSCVVQMKMQNLSVRILRKH